jgi:hypothetical protein
MFVKRSRLTFFLVLFFSLRLAGQSSREEQVSPARNSIEIVGTATLADGAFEGTAVDRRLFVFGATYSRVLSRRNIVETRFTSEIIPMALLREPFFMFAPVQAISSNQFTVMRQTYGFGASPLGEVK